MHRIVLLCACRVLVNLHRHYNCYCTLRLKYPEALGLSKGKYSYGFCRVKRDLQPHMVIFCIMQVRGLYQYFLLYLTISD